MPKRKRIQEIKRRLAREVAKAEKAEREELRQALAGPLDDLFWRDHERGEYCCPSCDANHPTAIAHDARREIEQFRAEQLPVRVTRTRAHVRVTR